MRLFDGMRQRVRESIVSFAVEVARKSNPALPSLTAGAQNKTPDGGQEPLDQNFKAYLKTPGKFAWVSSCVDAISTAGATVPLKLFRRTPDGPEEIEVHPLVTLFRNPNPEQGHYSFWYGLIQQQGYTGESYVTADEPFRVGTDEIWGQRADRMAPVPVKTEIRDGKEENPISHFTYTSETGGGAIRMETDEVVQIKRPHPTDPFRGLSPIKQLETMLCLEHAALQWDRAYFRNGAAPGVIIKRKLMPSKEEITRFQEAYNHRFQGAENAMRPLFVWGDETEVTDNGSTPRDASFLDLLEFTKAATLSVYNCPPFVVALPDGTTWANSREQKSFFYSNAVIPANLLITDTLNASPLVRAYGDDLYLAHDYSGVEALQPDKKLQAEVDHIYVTDGVRTINETREARSFGDPVPYGDKPIPSPLAYAYGINAFEHDVDDALAPSAPVAADPSEALSATFFDAVRKARGLRAKGAKDAATSLRYKAFVNRIQPYERAWAKEVRALTDDLLDTVLEVMDDETKNTLAQGSPLRLKADDDPIPSHWVNLDWVDKEMTATEWEAGLEPTADRTLKGGAEDILQEINDIFVPFDTTQPSVVEFIQNRLARQVSTILANRQAEIASLVQTMVEGGGTIGELEQGIRDHFDRNERAWSTRIARTETTGFYNAGAEDGIKEAGIETKEWLSSRDTDVRETHRTADSHPAIPVGADFHVGDATGPAPGQMSTVEENVNCRCTLVPGDV